jgi:putative SOS response-associated peptidase YedK
MPVIIAADTVGTWLDLDTSADRLHELLARAPDELLVAVAVSRLVNSPKNDGPQCIEAVGAKTED